MVEEEQQTAELSTDATDAETTDAAAAAAAADIDDVVDHQQLLDEYDDNEAGEDGISVSTIRDSMTYPSQDSGIKFVVFTAGLMNE